MESRIQQVVNKNKLSISRIPSWAKDVITERADEEFCGDYGMCIAQIVREANEYNCLKTKFFNSELGVKLISNDNPDEQKKPGDEIITGNGRVIKGGVTK